MKVRRLLFCLMMSVMLIVTYIPVTAFAADGDPEEVEYGTITMDIENIKGEWVQDSDSIIHWDCSDGSYVEIESSEVVDTENNEIRVPVGSQVVISTYPPNGYHPVFDVENNYPEFYYDAEGVLNENACCFTVQTENVVHISWEPGEFRETLSDEECSRAEPISVGEEKEVTGSCLFKFDPEDNNGTFIFYSKNGNEDADPYGRVESCGSELGRNDDYKDSNFNIFFKTDGEVYYLQANNSDKTATYTVGLKKSDILGISFKPNGVHDIEARCTSQYWDGVYFNLGDELTMETTEGKKTYVFKDASKLSKAAALDEISGEIYFVNKADPDDALTYDEPILYGEELFPLSEYKPGTTVTESICVEYAACRTYPDFKIHFTLFHEEMKKMKAAKAATCTKTGNKAYWYCSDCKKYFSDSAGTKQIKKNSWVIKAKGHKWKHIVKKGAFLKNGTEYDQCTVCKAKKNRKTLPGYSNYYVKSFKVKKGSKSFTAKWKKQKKSVRAKFDGYQIRYCKAKKGSKYKYVTVKKTKKSKKIKGLKNGTKYYVQVRTFTKVKGTTFYSKWSDKKSVTPKAKKKKKVRKIRIIRQYQQTTQTTPKKTTGGTT